MILSGRDNECKEQQERKHVEDKAGTENSRALEKGRIIRKPTIPVPVFAPRRGFLSTYLIRTFKFSSKCSTSTQTEDVGHVILTSVRLNYVLMSHKLTHQIPQNHRQFSFSVNIQ